MPGIRTATVWCANVPISEPRVGAGMGGRGVVGVVWFFTGTDYSSIEDDRVLPVLSLHRENTYLSASQIKGIIIVIDKK